MNLEQYNRPNKNNPKFLQIKYIWWAFCINIVFFYGALSPLKGLGWQWLGF